ncbi:MAG: hypothetical protein IPJ79_08830 [Bacteroidetes bacterium]|nr:hypothetical protein [Bacteroidota bacterium]
MLTDETVVDAGGSLIISSGTLQVADGAGVDLLVNGDMTFSGSFIEDAGQIDVASGATLHGPMVTCGVAEQLIS